MILEMLLLVLMALAAFAYVLAPIVMPGRERVTIEEESAERDEEAVPECVTGEQRPVHDLS